MQLSFNGLTADKAKRFWIPLSIVVG